ncbi:MAG: cupredoxin domain-containing protein [Solirubrobacteraceae bacterium]
MSPGSVTAALLLATTLPAGAMARAAPTDHRHAGTARLGALSPALRAPSLVALPARPQAGERVRLTLLNVPSGLRSVAWQLSGAPAGMRQTLGAAQISVVFVQAGVHRVAVQLIGAAASQSRALFVTVAPASRRPGALASPAGRAHPHRAFTPRHLAPRHVTPRHLAPHQVTPHHLARATGDPAVGIADFHFTPSAITIHVGDTVTWTNSGPSGHTATAHDGSFNTGKLSRGHSASHTFSSAGTFAYFCSIHPFMHGTVTVLAATTTSPSPAAASPNSASPATTPTAPAPTATAAAGPTLPNTGLAIGQEVGAGLALIALGLLARRGVRARRA